MSDGLSTLRLDRGSGVGIAAQIRARIPLLIADGELSSGERLPPVRALARQLDVNVNTVRTAYAGSRPTASFVRDTGVGGGSKGGGRSRERKEERVALRIDLHAIVMCAGVASDSPVPCKCLGVPVISQLVQELRRPFDVGDEERDGPGRKVLTHGASSSAARDLPSTPTVRPGDRPAGCANVLSLEPGFAACRSGDAQLSSR